MLEVSLLPCLGNQLYMNLSKGYMMFLKVVYVVFGREQAYGVGAL